MMLARVLTGRARHTRAISAETFASEALPGPPDGALQATAASARGQASSLPNGSSCASACPCPCDREDGLSPAVIACRACPANVSK
jgi:hypothetical protein